ncbi:unnamed protein product [Phyllotreta striolata]|uniref:Tumor protein p53-inducible nuclear protein 2 n=1 Tax=Phyllotreta striolata TaxID=444603 RepID=A0A9N9XWS5_PHYSR|nr:unnamed protein product [Phyllotreta striolata]
MFHNLANYLLGSVLGQDQRGSATEEPANHGNLRLRSSGDREDDWVLVDRDSEGNSELSESDAEDDAPASPASSKRRQRSPMEESWFVTPPPCFTSTGPVRVETSPMEDLLIEHPSMSVYRIHPARRHFPQATAPAAPSPDDVEDLQVEVELEEGAEAGEGLVVVNRVPRLNRLQVMQQQERQRRKGKTAQKAQVQKACQAIKRANLERTNKAREVNSRNRRQRRGERSQGATRSYANNNRKC